MSRLLDAYALVALLVLEPAADEIRDIIDEAPCHISALNLAEALDQLQRVRGVDEPAIRRAVEPLLASRRLVVAPVSEALGWHAAALRARHYRRRTSELSLADCVLLATAASLGAEVVSADPPVAAACRADGIGFVAVPDSRGRRP